MDKITGNILIVDDEDNIRNGLKAVLSRAGHSVRDAANGRSALTILESGTCEVAILDIRMPGMSGTELLGVIRERWPHVGVILLTGHGTLDSAITAVKQGAINYLIKPAKPDLIRQEVTAALTTVRRRRQESTLLQTLRSGIEQLDQLPTAAPATPARSSTATIKMGLLKIDRQAHLVWIGDDKVDVTPSEYRLLVGLAEREGSVVDYVTLVMVVLDYEAEPWEAKELIKRHVYALRKKLEAAPATPRYLHNVRGVGYRLSCD